MKTIKEMQETNIMIGVRTIPYVTQIHETGNMVICHL